MGTSESSNKESSISSQKKKNKKIGRIPSSELFCLNERELLFKLFKNLVQRSQHHRCIDQATFCRVFPLPGVLGERLFAVFDKNGDGFIERDEFFDGVAIVLKGSIEDKITFLFGIMDLDEQNKISHADLETVLNCIVSAQQTWINDTVSSPTTNLKRFNSFESEMDAVIDCESAVSELLEDAFAHCRAPNTEHLTLRTFAGWIVEHVYLWQVIEDTFKLNSTYNTSLTPGLRRRRSESLSLKLNNADHPLHHQSDHLLIDNVLEPKQSFSNQSAITVKSNLFKRRFDSTPSVPDCFGFLTKIGRRFGVSIKRWYLLRAGFLYVFKTPIDNKPRHVILLHGCQIKAIDDGSNGIELVIGCNTIRHQTKILFASSKTDQMRWIAALKQSGDAFVISDFFSVHEALGSGKFSTVYRVTDLKNESEEFAVKVIERRSLTERENKALMTEIAVLRLLNHPNIISIQHVFETVETICIVMQYIKGGDLFDCIVSNKRLTESAAKRVLFKLLRVIHYLHKRGIVHRDLKPENILLTADKLEILVIDFGLSAFQIGSESLKAPCGTLSYVAPEVLKGTGYGKEIDLWSAGVILYVMLRGKLPFDSMTKRYHHHQNNKNDKSALIKKVISGRFSMKNQIWNSKSNNCKDLIIRLLTVDPQKRLTAQNALRHPWFDEMHKSDHLKSVKEETRTMSF